MSMTTDELAAALGDARRVRERPFDLLREICSLRSSGADETTLQEMILRAMEQRQAFGSAGQILDALVRDVGLYPYLDRDSLSMADRIAFEAHRAVNLERVVFHHPQAKVFHRIMAGKSVVLSAPTSFGKSLIVDAIVAALAFENIVVVVPTLALIDETRRRLSRFREHYSIITHPSQKTGKRNVFVLTQERVINNPSLNKVDFFVIDEFYKLSPQAGEEDSRCTLLNQAFYMLSKRCKHFYLLGPGIRELSDDFLHAVQCEFFHEPYQTVVSELHRVETGDDHLASLGALTADFHDPTLVFCSSPDRARAAAEVLPDTEVDGSIVEAADWIAEHYHPDWHLVGALKRGIGIHHGRVPRALAQFIVRAFNEGRLRFLVCTSTLIEGVNTKAKNIVIFDHKVNRQAIDLFTFNNIRGRSGRMFHHFVGHVWIFHEPPQVELPYVDVPAFTQGAGASSGLLVQIEENELTDHSNERIRRFREHPELSFSTIRANAGVAPEMQIALAEELASDADDYSEKLGWTGIPNYEQLLSISHLIWDFFNGRELGSGSARSANQLAHMVNKLRSMPSIRDLIESHLPFAQGPDDAVKMVLDFQRLWATFHFPRLLRAVELIQRDVFSKRRLPVGKYEFFASRVENLFLGTAIVALDEYGIPLPLARRLESYISSTELDDTLARVRKLQPADLGLSSFERALVEEVQGTI